MSPSVLSILVWAFNAAVELEPSIAKLIDAVRTHPSTSAAVKAQLDDLGAQIKADEAEADALPPLPDPPPTAPSP